MTPRFYAAGNADLDSDGDGFADAREKFVYHTDPNDSNSRPVRVSGTVSYSGIETGPVFVVTVTESGSWFIAKSAALSGPGAYTNDEIGNNLSYWFKAFRDINSNNTREVVEPWGVYSANSTLITGDTIGINITLQDVPSISGTIDYGGYQTGDIHVIAVTTSNSWATIYETIIPWVQGVDSLSGDVTCVTFQASYTILGMPASNCWIRAFIDSNTNGTYTRPEAAGQYTSNSIPVGNRVTGINFTLDQDSDNDQMPDWWEWQYGFNPADSDDALLDRDNDGAANWKEYFFDINPDNTDSDGDGMKDGWEIQYTLNPANSNDALRDLDNDGLNNLAEYQLGTYPNNPDSDNDRIGDGPNSLTGIYAGPDPTPLTPAPNNLPSLNITASGKTLVSGEDKQGRPIVAWEAVDPQGKQQVYVMQWFGLASDTVGAWAELDGKWECFGASASGSGVTTATNGVTKFDMAVDTNGWPAVCWVEGRTGGTNLYYLTWSGTNWAELHNSYSNGINSIYNDWLSFAVDKTESGIGFTNVLNYSMTFPFDDCALVFDTQNRPVISYIRYIVGALPQASIQLKRDNGTNWVAMGSSTTTAGISGQGDYFFPQIAVGPDNRPVVSYFQWTGSPIGYLYARKWNPGASAWDVYSGSAVDETQYSTEIYDLAVNRSNEVLMTFQRVAYAPYGYPYQYGLWFRKSNGGAWAGYGGSDTGVGLCLTNAGYIQSVAPSIFVQIDNQAGVSWLQWGGVVYNWLLARQSANWAGMGYSFTGYGINLSGRRVGWQSMTPGNNQPVIAYSEQTGAGSSDPYKLVVKQYQADTDGDGLSDNFELGHGLNNATNDTDSDGLNDYDEWVVYGTNATNADTDADSLNDADELNGSSWDLPSNPLIPDSDTDGIADGADVFVNSPSGDQDGDGTPDALDADDDNDGLPDANDPQPFIPCDSAEPDVTPPAICILYPKDGAALGGGHPPTPTGLTASDGAYCDKVALTWNGSFEATSYSIRIYESGVCLATATVTAASYDHTAAKAYKGYAYLVRAENEYGVSANASDTGYLNAIRPSAPTGVNASKATYPNRVRVTWNAADCATAYVVWEGSSYPPTNRLANNVTGTNYDHTNAGSMVVRWYWIWSTNGVGSSISYGGPAVGYGSY